MSSAQTAQPPTPRSPTSPRTPKSSARTPAPTKGAPDGRRRKIAVDARFWRNLRLILKVVIPGLNSYEGLLLCVLTTQLVIRSFLTVIISRLAGKNGQLAVERNWEKFYKGVITFFLISFPAAFINSSRKYIQGMLALRFRKRLSEYVLKQYLNGVNFYKAVTYGGKDAISNPDQRVTADIQSWSEAIGELWAETFKPMLDVILFTSELVKILGWEGPAAMYGYFFLSATLKKNVVPPFGRLVATESELEGAYRTAHTRLIQNSEEIAFCNGVQRERDIIEGTLEQIQRHGMILRGRRFLVGCFDQLLVKYWASIAGYMVVSMPFILNKSHVANHTVSEISRDYILNNAYLTRLAQGVGDVVMVGNKLQTIAGYTDRVMELVERIQQLNKSNRAWEIKEGGEEEDQKEKLQTSAEHKAFVQGWSKQWNVRCLESASTRRVVQARRALATLPVKGGGVITEGDHIEFKHVDIVTPGKVLLVKDLNLEVQNGTHIMVTGANGCGKSSLFRVIGELWPLQTGELVRPKREEIFFVPQKPYLPQGTLRDQIIYPHTQKEMEEIGVTDDDLEEILHTVDPEKKITKTWGWDHVQKDWFRTFSGGQKQRVAIARMFYHKPKFAILDECTSAVSAEVEDLIYATAKDLGITIFTVSHRAQLQKHHTYVLYLHGSRKQGKWELTKVTEEEKKGKGKH